ncbi:hypothetical protein D187_002964 [Cystobacter fuscus DSM 2262]|uniref:HTH cro/C1-type domain-containing protein n=1 Tax=Cystobacter fuscus (strain ATCC 25194 / DSM 2262 / NBRC 100088 / M29) TaxID=1242864 RepID=S9QDP9_CYSF2|nr:transcriptional regulator [Cystobacter fuscus]EPX59474.1 hypothetical protein D187_002964 [Cystobacter fuscus DSM 2262]
MKRKFRQGLLPRSSEILGALARLCDWQPTRSAQDRTWRKFCQGEHIKGSTRRAIVEEMVESFVRKIDASLHAEGDTRTLAQESEALLGLLLNLAVWWDNLCRRLQHALPAEPTAFTTTVALRLVVVELAMRISGMLRLNHTTMCYPPDLVDRQQVEAHRLLLSHALREALKSAGITRMALAEALDVTKEAVDQWLKDAAIIPEHRVDDIARVIAQKKGMDLSEVSDDLRKARQLSLVVKPLADVVGKDELGRLFMSLLKLITVAQGSLLERTESLAEEVREDLLYQLFTAGGESPLGPTLRGAMLEKIPDESWKHVIATPMGKWVELLRDVAAVETVSARIEHFFKGQGFSEFAVAKELLHQWVLLPRDSPSHPWAPLFALPPEESAQAYVACLQHAFHTLAGKELTPEALVTVGVLAQVFTFVGKTVKEGLKAEVEAYQWQCQGLFIQGCLIQGCRPLKEGAKPETNLWFGRVLEALRSLPPVPQEVPSVPQDVLMFLGRMKRMQEDVDSRRTSTLGP